MAVLKNASLFKLLHWPEEVNRLLALIPNLLTSLQTFLRMKNRPRQTADSTKLVCFIHISNSTLV